MQVGCRTGRKAEREGQLEALEALEATGGCTPHLNPTLNWAGTFFDGSGQNRPAGGRRPDGLLDLLDSQGTCSTAYGFGRCTIR